MKWLKVKYLIRLFERIYLEKPLDNNSPQIVSVTLFSEILSNIFSGNDPRSYSEFWMCVCVCVHLCVCMRVSGYAMCVWYIVYVCSVCVDTNICAFIHVDL